MSSVTFSEFFLAEPSCDKESQAQQADDLIWILTPVLVTWPMAPPHSLASPARSHAIKNVHHVDILAFPVLVDSSSFSMSLSACLGLTPAYRTLKIEIQLFWPVSSWHIMLSANVY